MTNGGVCGADVRNDALRDVSGGERVIRENGDRSPCERIGDEVGTGVCFAGDGCEHASRPALAAVFGHVGGDDVCTADEAGRRQQSPQADAHRGGPVRGIHKRGASLPGEARGSALRDQVHDQLGRAGLGREKKGRPAGLEWTPNQAIDSAGRDFGEIPQTVKQT
ncbi:MAG: hypothetical protein DWQ29_16785 [Planctomycetota bacterium]|nr:MAG: hypothetical protein DWQ29_16785 [Planctomycetota bacterium]